MITHIKKGKHSVISMYISQYNISVTVKVEKTRKILSHIQKSTTLKTMRFLCIFQNLILL